MSWRAGSRADRQVALFWALCVGTVFALRPVLIPAAHLLPPCLWHVWTGVPCPSCGTTRALVRLLRFDLPGAIAMNPLATASAVAFFLGGVVAPVWLALGGRVPVVTPGPKPAWIVLVTIAVIANWGWLIAARV
jgi:Protein of unknown function (DUF2752)